MASFIFYPILGMPLAIWFGLAVLLLLLAVGTLGYLVGRGKAKINWHINMARLVIVLGLLHGLVMFYVFVIK